MLGFQKNILGQVSYKNGSICENSKIISWKKNYWTRDLSLQNFKILCLSLVLAGLTCCVNERVVVLQVCVVPGSASFPGALVRGSSAVGSWEKTLLLALSDSHVFKGEQGSPTQLQENAPVFPISWAKTCPPRKILTDHRCIKSCRLMPRHGAT